MTSGYDCDDHKNNFACEQNMYKSKDWLEYAVNLPMANLPGEHWAYNSTSLWFGWRDNFKKIQYDYT